MIIFKLMFLSIIVPWIKSYTFHYSRFYLYKQYPEH